MTLPKACAGTVSRRPTRALAKTAEPGKASQSRGQRSLSHLGSARRSHEQRTGGHGLAHAGCVAVEMTERDPPRPPCPRDGLAGRPDGIDGEPPPAQNIPSAPIPGHLILIPKPRAYMACRRSAE